MAIIKLESQYCEDVAKLHIEGISTGFISSLGLKFVTALYYTICRHKSSFGFVAVDSGKVIGFVAFSTKLSGLYKFACLRYGIKFGFILFKYLFSIERFKKIFANTLYAANTKKVDLPDAELLSIAVAPDGRGKGIAEQMVRTGLAECGSRGIDKVKVLVDAKNEPANRLYQKTGFVLADQIDSHGVLSNVYVADLCIAQQKA